MADPKRFLEGWEGRLATIGTPALVVDRAAARRNHERAMHLLAPGQMLRPHFKAHKSTPLALLQREWGTPGICCQTSWEAVALARAGIDDIMLTNQVVDAAGLAEIAEAAAIARLTVVIDAAPQVDLLAAAAARAGALLDVLVEIDLGMARCGVVAEDPVLPALAGRIAATPGLRFAGLQAYDGHVAGIADPALRRVRLAESAALLERAVTVLSAAGFPPEVVAGCATSHLPDLGMLRRWTDIQAGSYILMDGTYGLHPDLAEFEQAVMVLATVIHASEGRAVFDAGLKHLAVDRGPPHWIGDPGTDLRLSDEHAVLRGASAAALAMGDRAWLRPRHIDPTLNLHPGFWLAGEELAYVAIDARMPPARRAS